MAARRKSGENLFLRYCVLAAWALFCLVPILWFLSIGFRGQLRVWRKVAPTATASRLAE